MSAGPPRPLGPAAATRPAPLLIAIDGPAGSGKSTLAKALSSRLGLRHIDTGAMYRAIAWKALSNGVPPEDTGLVSGLLDKSTVDFNGEAVCLDGQDVSEQVRSKGVGSAASLVAQNPAVRAWMVTRQRELVTEDSTGAVVEGRDIGTVVLPKADLKIYLTADLKERARRRALQRSYVGAEALARVAGRDRRDTERKDSPLAKADDAVVVDTTKLSVGEIVEKVTAMLPAQLPKDLGQ